MSRRDTPRTVYFVEAGRNGPIKIGVAVDVDARIRELQVGNSSRLSLIVSVPGVHADENRLHRRFKAECVGGEWFKAKGLVRDFALSLVGMTEEERIASIQFEPEPPQPKKRKPNKKRVRSTTPAKPRRSYTDEERHAMLFVGDGGSIYRSAEAEEALVRPSPRDWQEYIRRQNQIEAEERHKQALGRR